MIELVELIPLQGQKIHARDLKEFYFDVDSLVSWRFA